MEPVLLFQAQSSDYVCDMTIEKDSFNISSYLIVDKAGAKTLVDT